MAFLLSKTTSTVICWCSDCYAWYNDSSFLFSLNADDGEMFEVWWMTSMRFM